MSENNDCDKTQFKPPVNWLMGRELLAGLKWIMTYSFMGDKQDPKDWMYGETITAPRSNNNAIDPYWFDYIADTGDGMKAVYNIAYLCMSELWLDGRNNIGADGVALEGDATHNQPLPRGEFLFVGGDTAYHIADTASLKERFQMPFNCAALDIIRSGKAVDQRPIYGVPANHDYYDVLDGFNRQFCKPITDDTHNPLRNDPKDPQLGLLGFERTQKTSYVAIELPFNWHLWGLDPQSGKMDKRQFAFFVASFCPNLVKTGEIFNKANRDKVLQEFQQNIPAKLIVTTPEPSTVFGKWAKKDDAIVKTFESLGLEASFMEKKSGKLNQAKCRLDISGDIHHYERYWGSEPTDPNPTNYASVVAGGGGAFLHPSHTDIEEVKRAVTYPARKDSHTLMTQAILKPWNIFLGGYIWLVGGVIAFMSYFAVTIPQSTWSLFNLMPDNLRPPLTVEQGTLSRVRAALDIPGISPSFGLCANDYCFDLFYIVAFAGLFGFWLWKAPGYLDKVKNSGTSTWRRKVLLFMLPIIVGVLLLLILIFITRGQLPHPFLAGLLIDFSFLATMLLFSLSRRYSDILIDRARLHRETHFKLLPAWVYEKLGIAPESSFESLPLWGYNLLGVSYLAFGVLRYGVYPTSIMAFDLLIAIVWALSTLGLVALAIILGGQLHHTAGKARFAAIGLWHAILQVTVPVCLVMYSSWASIVIVSVVTVAITLMAGWLFTRDFLVKDFALADQKRIGNLLFAAWAVVGICILLAVSWGDPIAVDGWRLFVSFILGALFSCIWFGWYVAVSLAFHGHNNEAGGGARSEQYRHMIRFKLTENSLTGYVIGIDNPVTDFSDKSNLPKFRLVDVFTIQSKGK